jgi:hypothetical protein
VLQSLEERLEGEFYSFCIMLVEAILDAAASARSAAERAPEKGVDQQNFGADP